MHVWMADWHLKTEETKGGGEKKKSRMVNMTKRPSRCTTMDDKGQTDLKGVTHDEISTKEGYNVRIVNSNARVNDESERRIWWIRCRQWFGWKVWACSKWRDKVDIAGETDNEEENNEHRKLRHIPEDVRVRRG